MGGHKKIVIDIFACHRGLINCLIVLDILEGQKRQGWVFWQPRSGSKSRTNNRKSKTCKQKKKKAAATSEKKAPPMLQANFSWKTDMRHEVCHGLVVNHVTSLERVCTSPLVVMFPFMRSCTRAKLDGSKLLSQHLGSLRVIGQAFCVKTTFLLPHGSALHKSTLHGDQARPLLPSRTGSTMLSLA